MMHTLIRSSADPEVPGLQIVLELGVDSRLRVRRLSAALGPAQLILSLPEAEPVHAVLRRSIADRLEEMCRTLLESDTTEPVTTPPEGLCAPGLRLAGVTLRLSRRPGRRQRLTVLARSAEGTLASLLRDGFLPSGTIESEFQALADRALERFYLPIANLNYLLDEVLDAGNAVSQAQVLAALERLRSHTLTVQAEFSSLISELSPERPAIRPARRLPAADLSAVPALRHGTES
ncbi:hypothetical protein FDP22_02840 [Paroceanicella profunda]|uniref:Uncharacterized protein n=1 Tax=Paroceanicella profunda TaxID=2579971 RepID=A0A5B8FR16_9RHOB|nr:hypothetical protein [Paroceanicella profunda]QDL90815.1 hypothetical protein FDP22_02840 [Paroceanicella profunda]